MGAKILIIDHNDSFTYNLAGLFEGAGKKVTSVKVWSVDELPQKNLYECLGYDGVVLSPGPGLPEDYPAVKRLLDFLLCAAEGRQGALMPVPILGICLGLQTIVRYFGGRLYNLSHIQHGRQVALLLKGESCAKGTNTPFGTETKLMTGTQTKNDSQAQAETQSQSGAGVHIVNNVENCSAMHLFDGLATPIKVGLYHSWGMDNQSAVPALSVLATAILPAADKEHPREVVMAICHKSLPVYGLQFHPESFMTPGGLQIVLNWLHCIESIKSR